MAKSPLSPRAQAKLVELIRDNSIHVEEYNPHEEKWRWDSVLYGS